MEKSMEILITNRNDIEGELIGAVTQEVIENLNRIAYEREKLSKRSEKLEEKKKKVIRSAHKRINQFAKSRQIQYDEKNEAIGIYESDIIYVGSKERLKSDPTVAPIETDKVKGNLTKTEKRLYLEELGSYAFLNKQINEYMNDLMNNEMELVSFQKSVLKDKEYDVEKQHLIVSVNDGKIYLSIYNQDGVTDGRN